MAGVGDKGNPSTSPVDIWPEKSDKNAKVAQSGVCDGADDEGGCFLSLPFNYVDPVHTLNTRNSCSP